MNKFLVIELFVRLKQRELLILKQREIKLSLNGIIAILMGKKYFNFFS
ncbi:MAG: hypothetical protein R2771_02435 [Saprospiraceae bacterium]